MSNAAGIKIADSILVETNISDQRSKDALALMADLYASGCVNPTGSWAESADGGGFIEGTTVMTTGDLWFVRTSNRWKEDMWGADTRYGYVPFPYPDDVKKEDTRISQSGLSVYMFVAGRAYPAGVNITAVYRAINDMFLNTIKYQEADPSFNATEIKYNSLSSRIDNPASITAIMYYDSKRVFYDPCHAIYSSISATPLKTPCVNVVFNAADYDQEFDAVYNTYDTAFKNIYA